MRRALQLALGGWAGPRPTRWLVRYSQGRAGHRRGIPCGIRRAPRRRWWHSGPVRRPRERRSCSTSSRARTGGRLPPCVDAIIEAGVKTRGDRRARSQPRGTGRCPKRLPWRASSRGRAASRHRLRRSTRRSSGASSGRNRPFLAVRWQPPWMGSWLMPRDAPSGSPGVESRDFVHWLRAGFDGIAVGRRTAETDESAADRFRGAVPPRVPADARRFHAGGLRNDLNIVRSAKEVPTVVITDPLPPATAEKAFAGTGSSWSRPRAASRHSRLSGSRYDFVAGGGRAGTLITALPRMTGGSHLLDPGARVPGIRNARLLANAQPTLLGEAVPWIATDRQAMARTRCSCSRRNCVTGIVNGHRYDGSHRAPGRHARDQPSPLRSRTWRRGEHRGERACLTV